jgi:alpha-tubulin suppressor-like RCC1 family protein
MEPRNKLCISNLLVLDHHFQLLCSTHYPREITYLIIFFYYKLFKIKIACSENHFMALVDNQLYSWGILNHHGELGLGHTRAIYNPTKNNLSDVVQISCGYAHSLALTKSGQLYAWGSNKSGQLGLGTRSPDESTDKTNSDIPVMMSFDYFAGSPIKKIVAGVHQSVVLTKSGQVYTWGDNWGGKFNFNFDNEQFIQAPKKLDFGNDISIKKVSCGFRHAMALSASNKIFNWCCGSIYSRNALFDRNFLQECSHSNISDIICSDNYPAIVIGDDIYFEGEFPYDHADQKYLCEKITCPYLKKVVCGKNHFMVLNKMGEVYVRGYNDEGQLGLGHHKGSPELQKLDLPPIKKIICADFTSFAISEMNEIYVWGKGYTNKPHQLII